MKILAGNQEINILGVPVIERVYSEGQLRKGCRITLSEGLTKEQISALLDNNWVLDDESGQMSTLEGYNTLVRHEISIANVPTKTQEIRTVLDPILEALTDEQADKFTELYPEWNTGKTYCADNRVRFNNILYKCITEHISQSDWTPDVSPSLWTRVIASTDDEIVAWVQPESTNPYMSGDKVTHNGTTWVSDIDNNVWEPGVYGWSEL